MVTCLLERAFDTAGQWQRAPFDPMDFAARDFKLSWESSLTQTWEHLRGHGTRRARAGRPQLGWDAMLSLWSDGRWRHWAANFITWQELTSDWVRWARARCGLAETKERACGVRSDAICVSHRPASTQCLIAPTSCSDGFHIFTDSMIMARTMQGRWLAKQPWLHSFVRSANDAMQRVPGLSGTGPDAWWISHITRWHNLLADACSKFARESTIALTLFVLSQHDWQAWRTSGPAGSCWYMTLDGSTVPEPGFAKGTSGAAALLWHKPSGALRARLVAVAASSSWWSTAASSEAAALQLAFALLEASTALSIDLQGIFAIGDPEPWCALRVWQQCLQAPVQLSAPAFLECIAFDIVTLELLV